VVQEHKGYIDVESSGRGTVFTLYFPATDEELTPEESEEPDVASIRGQGESILVVDDEPTQLEIAGKILTQLGYQVFQAASGEEALEFLKERAVDLVLLDMIMEPGMNGRQAYEAILAIYPAQKAIIVTGFSASAEVRKAQLLGPCGFLKKPYTIEELGRAVREQLAR